MTRALWIGGAAVCLAGSLLYGFETNNPNALRWLSLACFAAIPVAIWIKNGCQLSQSPIVLTILGFLGYAILSLTWTHDWREGILSLNQMGLVAVLFLTLLHVDRASLVRAIPLAAMAAITLTIGISIYQPGIFGGLGNENFQAEFLVLSAPLAAMGVWSWRHSPVAMMATWFAIAALGQALFFNTSDAKWAGLAGLGAVSILALYAHKRFIIATVMSAAGLTGLFFALKGSRLTSVLERFELSSNTFWMWLDNPILGVGIGSFNHQYPFYQEAHVRFLGTKVVRSIHNYAGAAHNDYLQMLAVFGLVGAAILAGLAFLVWRSRHRDVAADFGLGTLAIFAGLALVGFPAQNPATIILAVAALSLVTRLHAPQTCPVSGCALLARSQRGA